MPAGLAHAKAMAAGEDNPAFGVAIAEDFADVVDVDDRGAVDPDEALGVKGVGELFDGLAQRKGLAVRVDIDVIVGGLDPFNLVDGDK